MSRDKVFIAFQTNEDSRPSVEAILEDNPEATVDEQPAMVKILAPGRLVVKRSTIEDKIGRDFVLQSIHINLISLAGNISEDEDEFVLAWHQA
jgi:phenol hydroxylase P2 protein